LIFIGILTRHRVVVVVKQLDGNDINMVQYDKLNMVDPEDVLYNATNNVGATVVI
jgi:hypothetical protein